MGHVSTTELVREGIFKKSCIRRKPLLAEGYKIKMPSSTQWISFSEALDDCSVWKWENEYWGGLVSDGTSWKIEIEFSDGRSVHSSGHNAFPIATQWEIFNSSIYKLLGVSWRDYKE